MKKTISKKTLFIILISIFLLIVLVVRGGSICLNNRSQIISDKFTVKKSNLPPYIIMQQDPRNTILHKPHQGFVCPDSNVLALNCTTLNSA